MGVGYNLVCNIDIQQLDVILVAGLAFLEILMYSSAFLLIALICLNLENHVKNEVTRERFTIEAIHDRIKQIHFYNGVMGKICWLIFIGNQLFIIIATYMMVSDLKNFYIFLFVLNLCFFLTVLIGKLEHCYDLIRDTVMKIRN